MKAVYKKILEAIAATTFQAESLRTHWDSAVSGYRTVTLGSNHRNDGYKSICIGNSNSGFGNSSISIGEGCLNEASQSVTIGLGAYDKSIIGSIVFGAGNTHGQGKVQYGRAILSGRTTSATPKILCTNGDTQTYANQLTLQDNSALSVRFNALAFDETTRTISRWSGNVAVRRGANATTTAPQEAAYIAKIQPPVANTYALAITADTTLGAVRFTVTGGTNPIQWLVNAEWEEIVI